MTQPMTGCDRPSVHTHSAAVAQFRRPFAAGAIGFRIMRHLPADETHPSGVVIVAPYLRAQSVLVRLNSVVPGRWCQRFDEFELDLNPVGGGARLFLICRLTVTLPREPGGPDIDVAYEDVGEADTIVNHPVKALYSDARKRAAAAAGIGTYLYTVLPETMLPAGAESGQVATAADGELVLTRNAAKALREQYEQVIATQAIKDEFGEALSHGEPRDGSADPVFTKPRVKPATIATASAAAPAHVSAADGKVDRDQEVFGGWGRGGRPSPPPAPVAFVGGEAELEAIVEPAAATSAPATLSADHRESICREADAGQISSGALANIVLETSGQKPLDERRAAREFDSGLLSRTPDALMPRIVAAIRSRAAGQQQLTTRSASGAGEVPVDFGGLSDDGA